MIQAKPKINEKQSFFSVCLIFGKKQVHDLSQLATVSRSTNFIHAVQN